MGAVCPAPCEGWTRNARQHVKDGIGGNIPLYSRTTLLSSGFAKKVFRKNSGKVLTSPAGVWYNERRQAENGRKKERRKNGLQIFGNRKAQKRLYNNQNGRDRKDNVLFQKRKTSDQRLPGRERPSREKTCKNLHLSGAGNRPP